LCKKACLGYPIGRAPFGIDHPDIDRRPRNPNGVRDFQMNHDVGIGWWLERIQFDEFVFDTFIILIGFYGVLNESRVLAKAICI
jgi:hypothetical protein